MRNAAVLHAALAVAIVTASCNSYEQEIFSTQLTGANAVPPVATQASGTLNVTVDGPVASYTLTIGGAGLQAITSAHLHQGNPGSTGGIVVFLWEQPPAGPLSPDAPFTGTLSSNTFSAPVVTACAPGCVATRSFENIVAGMATHTVYADVHTAGSPGIEIRGNF